MISKEFLKNRIDNVLPIEYTFLYREVNLETQIIKQSLTIIH